MCMTVPTIRGFTDADRIWNSVNTIILLVVIDANQVALKLIEETKAKLTKYQFREKVIILNCATQFGHYNDITLDVWLFPAVPYNTTRYSPFFVSQLQDSPSILICR